MFAALLNAPTSVLRFASVVEHCVCSSGLLPRAICPSDIMQWLYSLYGAFCSRQKAGPRSPRQPQLQHLSGASKGDRCYTFPFPLISQRSDDKNRCGCPPPNPAAGMGWLFPWYSCVLPCFPFSSSIGIVVTIEYVPADGVIFVLTGELRTFLFRRSFCASSNENPPTSDTCVFYCMQQTSVSLASHFICSISHGFGNLVAVMGQHHHQSELFVLGVFVEWSTSHQRR